MKKKNKIIILSFLVFIAFVLLSYLVTREYLVRFDFDTMVRLQDNFPRRFDAWLSLLSTIGSFEILSIVLILIIIVIKKIKGILILIPYAVLHLIEIYGKTFVDQTKPPFFFLRTENILQFPSSYVESGFSYPSGHSARTTFLALVLAILIYKSKKLSQNTKYVLLALLTVFCLLMFVSRIYLGEHWATDVIGGILLGASLSIFSFLLI